MLQQGVTDKVEQAMGTEKMQAHIAVTQTKDVLYSSSMASQ